MKDKKKKIKKLMIIILILIVIFLIFDIVFNLFYKNTIEEVNSEFRTISTEFGYNTEKYQYEFSDDYELKIKIYEGTINSNKKYNYTEKYNETIFIIEKSFGELLIMPPIDPINISENNIWFFQYASKNNIYKNNYFKLEIPKNLLNNKSDDENSKIEFFGYDESYINDNNEHTIYSVLSTNNNELVKIDITIKKTNQS